ncbi:uncharacterized protein A1O9_07870 [Exophiala aquamarina CBS 119918]|uniref:GPI-anchored wall transfer protein n=1 Tax=Exophiala aquamarina CBS 119918 TaxID=1182545 RepID=A0A072P895_9EURO|nr:uncharacterized protein A1O9_07870 [Exophiala aquamarina CBS 119918]KEF56289.1 hypothetical protein A1O9_07870 [Exophiala aquamarina CBS 119918]
MASASYKARKEAFVSNLFGSSLTDINLVTLVAASAVLLWTALQRRRSLFTPYTPVAAAADFLLNVSAILFAITLYSSAPLVLNISLITPAVLLLLLSSSPENQGSAAKSKQQKKPSKSRSPQANAKAAAAAAAASKPARLPVRPFVTHYRGSMMVVTCLAILAVDFPIFPRRFAKVETWGTSLMDLGVGSFVFSAGVVSARGLVKSEQVASNGGKSIQSTFITRFAQAARHSIPLLVLGFIRLWSVKGLDYAEHVSEYGVHWNFFFTLGFLPPFAELSDTITRKLVKRYEILAFLLAAVYEITLNSTELLRYILVSPRGPDLLSKNREGVFSFIGYLSIFLAGRGTGVFVMQYQELTDGNPKTNKPLHYDTDPTTSTNRERNLVLKKLLIQSAIHGTLFLLSTSVYTCNLNVSRRLANLPYVLWIVAFNNAQILLFGLVESLGPRFSYHASDSHKVQDATSLLLRVYNSNGLAVFLVANLLTGLVNLTVNTLDMRNLAAIGVLFAYAAAVTVFAITLDFSGVKIKL